MSVQHSHADAEVARDRMGDVVLQCVEITVQLLRKPLAYTDLWRWVTDGLLALAH